MRPKNTTQHRKLKSERPEERGLGIDPLKKGSGEEMESVNGNGGGGGKRKIEDAVELAKQKAQAIAARLLSDADSKRPRLFSDSASPDFSSPSFPSNHQSSFHAPPTATPNVPANYTTTPTNVNGGGVPSSKKILIPNAKVGVIIGRGGEMIKNLQLESGARIQITRDADADPTSLTRDVELMGTLDQISRAEQRIHEVIAETDATSSASSGNRGSAPPQAGGDQLVMKVPNDKVALVIGKGGETIKVMQTKSGARIQVVPLHLPPGDASIERNIFINGTQEQIDSAKELVNEVISGNRLKVLSGTNTYQQPGYPPSTGWAPQGQPSVQQPPAYGYTQPGTYAMPPPPYYGGYPPQPTAWDQSAAPQQQNTGYSAYGQTQPTASTPPPAAGYNYSQMPPAAGYNYNQGYPQQQPSYGQDTSDQTKPYTNPAYAPLSASTQPDGSGAAQTSQPGYGAAAISDGTAQIQPPSAFATAYSQPQAAPNGYNAYPSYSGAAPVQPAYNLTGYSQAGYGQPQDGQIASQSSYSYYGQSGYPPSQAPAHSGYYQSVYPPTVPPLYMPPQTQPQGTNTVSQTSSYGVERTDGGDAAPGPASASVADESEKTQS